MTQGFSRRTFLGSAVAAALPWPRGAYAARELAVTLGYAAITWGEDTQAAITDVAAVGFRGIQLRSKDLTKLGEQHDAIKALLEKNKLELMCFSSGNIGAAAAADAKRAELLELHVKNARFVKAMGGRHMQVTATRPVGRAATALEFERLADFMNELGSRTSDLGVRIAYHNHMDDFGEAPDDVARVLELTECRYVDFLLDIAHYKQGGGDPAAAVLRHEDRLALVHLKDVRDVEPKADPATGKTGKPYQFVELGRGRVDVPAVMAALKKIAFRGPLVIELDSVPDAGRTPKQCAETNKAYVMDKLGLGL
jgi:inosose dehydratase